MSQLTIEPGNARIAVLGYQPEVSRIYWSALPLALPVYGQTLDLSGCEIKAVYADGSETVVTEYCTFTPDTGEAVPSADTLTVTATYTARSGKACQADTTLPIVTLDHIKIIIPRTVPDYIKEQGATGGENPTFTDYAQAFGFGGVYVAAYWSRGGEIVRVTKLDTDSVLSSPNLRRYWFNVGDYPDPGPEYFIVRKTGGTSATFERYYTPTEHEEVSYSQTFILNASFEFAGDTYTDTAYLSADYLVGERLADPPLEYTGTETKIIDVREDIVLLYTQSGQQPLSTVLPYITVNPSTRPHLFIYYPYTAYVEAEDPIPYGPPFNGCWSAKLTLEDNANGWFRFMTEPSFTGTGLQLKTKTRWEFSCSNGAISWTINDY